MRSVVEILQRMKDVEREDWMGTIRGELIGVLPYEAAKDFLKPETTAEAWKPVGLEREAVIGRIADYMDFAIGKAEDHRGLSASRSIDHMKGLVWLLGDEDFQAIDWGRYSMYGAPILKQIMDKYGIARNLSGDFQRMADGLECEPNCELGCNS